MLTRAPRSTERFKPLEEYPSKEQRIAGLDEALVRQYWVLEECRSESEIIACRNRIDRILDTRLFLMKHA